MALETVRGRRGRFVVAIGPTPFDPHEELRGLGIEIVAADTLVVIHKPVAIPVVISVDGQAC
ncbi:hypothetical protein KZ813_17900 [Sphingomonas sp. RHCKR7]|uniref:hypothetical protein n=1 Tax=Sphingomonas folli TaxID=2862497 RepID=UPI001CA4B83A|nr:hypothetical protein [Sphingomonas folli]MBW6528719.1 hypothetical protein [Sphingomonas folli]